MEHSSRMSSTILSSSTSWCQNSKQFNMHEVVHAAREFQLTRSEETVKLIIRHLSLLGVAIDKSIYDPNTSIVSVFFSTLLELLSHAEPQSTLSWGCVSVLETACKNQAARHQLIHTYEFIPLLAQLLNDRITMDKKIRLLTVLQELSCGVKIAWIVPQIQQLMNTLLKWIQNENESEQVVLLSLGIIINLCFKNPPALYMLSICVDIKQFATFVLKLKGNKIDALVCKFLIIIDHDAGVVPEETFLRLLKVTFNSIKESFISNNPMELRQLIDFYFHVKVQGDNVRRLVMERLMDYPAYVEKVTGTIIISSRETRSDISSIHNPECMSLVFKFLKCISDLRLPNLDQFYEKQTRIALDWIQVEQVSSDALCLLRSILLSSQWKSNTLHIQIMELILDDMPILFTTLQNIDNGTVMNIDLCMRLSNIVELLKILVDNPQTRVRVMAFLSQEQLDKIFQLSIGNNKANNFTQDSFPMYTNTLSLISCIAKHHLNWQDYLNAVLKQPQILTILAESLHKGSLDVQKTVLEIIRGNSNFPCDLFAKTMAQLCQNVSSPISSTNYLPSSSMYYSLKNSMAFKADEAITFLKEARTSQRINISTCDVMEVYEFKIASMEHAERAAMASVEAASARCSQLQHQVVQLSAELSRFRQLFLYNQQMQKEVEASYENKVRDLNRENADKVQQMQEEAKEREAHVTMQNKQIDELTNSCEKFEMEVKNTMKINSSLQESIKKMQKLNEKKEDAYKNLQADLKLMNNRVLKTEEICKSTEIMLEERTRELNTALQESEERRKLIETIMKLAHTQK